jgi:outer membrane protein OmpA-like peptidoglycan-associated protein
MAWFSRTRAAQSEETKDEVESDEPVKSHTGAERLLNLQRAVGNEAVQGIIPPRSMTAAGSAGEPITKEIRKPLEQSLGANVSDVRVHADAASAESAKAIDAEAYTKGRDIYFAPGKYAPETSEGRWLLAHELVHTVQQSGSIDKVSTDDVVTGPEAETVESEANALATSGREVAAAPISHAAGVRIQRQKTPGAPATPTTPASLKPSWDAATLNHFASDKANLTNEHQVKLAELSKAVSQLLASYPDTFITIVGHTDATDTERHNKELGQRRADAVKSALVSLGVPAEVMRAASLGESALLIDTQAPEARNRRVEINIFKRSFFAERLPKPDLSEKPREAAAPILPSTPLPRVPVPYPKEETREEIAKRNEEIWKKAQEIKKEREEEKKRSGTSLTEKVENFVDQQMKKTGLPHFFREKVKDLAGTALEKGIETAFELLSKDTALSDKQKDIMGKILEGAIKAK